MRQEILATVPVELIGTEGTPVYPPVGFEHEYEPSKCEQCGRDTLIGPRSREMKATGVLKELCMICAYEQTGGQATVETLGGR